jgi:CRISPR system Cascade subunit CasA
MNLLTDPWVPIRPAGGPTEKINLQTLLCDPQKRTLCLPRDDMELATLQLLICLLQVIWPPKDDSQFRQRIGQVFTEEEFQNGIEPWLTTFDLTHPEHPFMQVKGVKAKAATGMDKLLAGLTGATNCTFVNEPGQGGALCSACAATALFNQANNAPGFGGGFKSGLRGGTPVTTLIRGEDIRTTLWLNVLTKTRLDACIPQWQETPKATWQSPIKAGEKIQAATIGLLRGLFWQPAHIELCPPVSGGHCSACGFKSDSLYDGFLKAKFNFTVEGLWPHPHSPRLQQIKKGNTEEKFLAFTTAAPSWTQISRILVSKQVEKGKEGSAPAAILVQLADIFPHHKLQLIIGGYRNNQASILERRHDVLSFNLGWETHLDVINKIVETGLGYKTALRKALFVFAEGFKNSDLKGAGVSVHEVAERQYYRQSDLLIPDVIATLNSESASNTLQNLRAQLQRVCEQLFEQVTAPYVHHPKLIKALAVARVTLRKHLSDMKPQGEKDDSRAA